MPFGNECVLEIFLKRTLSLFDDIENEEIYFYNLIVRRRNEMEYDITIEEALDKTESSNSKFNPRKI